MLARFNRVMNEMVFNYEEVLNRQKIKQENIDKLRERVKVSKCVPKILDDRHVSRSNILIVLIL